MPPITVDGRSDTIDIIHTAIDLDLLNTPQVTARCRLTMSAKVTGVTGLRLDLENLVVDSVLLGGTSLSFSQSGPALFIALASAPMPGDTFIATIDYHGQPASDASGWGGFYQTGDYAFNLGVGFAADPHSFGRAWMPCFDNFIERSTYEFHITTNPSFPAYCNGTLTEETVLPGELHRSWRIDQPIPSYLACFASGPYASWKRDIGGIPIEIAAAAADTGKVTSTFLHLPEAIECYQHWYGSFKWPKIGYSLVPFNSGAMEHATNVAIGRPFVDGSLNYETLWAHELSHHWWGDLATCSTAGDMWLNEGWAVFSEHLFTEWVYGRSAYLAAVQSNFLYVLEKTHVNEGEYRAVSGIPHEFTYGEHVYNKGAVVAHNLRGYLGDSLFRTGISMALDENSFSDWNSAMLRDKLSAVTGLDLTDFFEDWVFSPGFTHFAIDSVTTLAGTDSTSRYMLFVKQKRRGAPHLYQNVPLEFTFVNSAWERTTRTATVSGEHSEITVELPKSFNPKFFWTNTNLNLTFARADKELVVKSIGSKNFSPAKMTMNVTALADSALVRVEHHYAHPDSGIVANPNNYALSNRYWTVDGDFPPGFDAYATVFYDGRGQVDQLDTELFEQTGSSEDSVVLLFRPAAGYPWSEYSQYTKNTLSSASDKYGFFRIEHIMPGEYTIAKGTATVGYHMPAVLKSGMLKAVPNPAGRYVTLSATNPFDRITVYSEKGDILRQWTVQDTTTQEIALSDFAPGKYWFSVNTRNGAASCLVIVAH
ncbi:MAG: M1 family metallopeptidase [Lewinellaceae bacterium]|nr:M1 family metallopeptidase [Lewinellaceae bacterium]